MGDVLLIAGFFRKISGIKGAINFLLENQYSNTNRNGLLSLHIKQVIFGVHLEASQKVTEVYDTSVTNFINITDSP